MKHGAVDVNVSLAIWAVPRCHSAALGSQARLFVANMLAIQFRFYSLLRCNQNHAPTLATGCSGRRFYFFQPACLCREAEHCGDYG